MVKSYPNNKLGVEESTGTKADQRPNLRELSLNVLLKTSGIMDIKSLT